MDWQDVEDILFDGTKEEISKISCPECGGSISFLYDDGYFKMECTNCHTVSKFYKAPLPNCVEYFGEAYTITVE